MKESFFVSLIAFLIILPGSAFSDTRAGVALPETVTTSGKTLALNGMGVRKATIFKVKVYVMGLYLESKSKDPSAILSSDGVKQVTMQFVRSVSAEKLRDGWSEGVKKNSASSDALKEKLKEFNETMSDVETKDQLVLKFVGEGVEVEVNGIKKGAIQGRDFQKGLLSVWLGPHPPNKDLKKGILGITH